MGGVQDTSILVGPVWTAVRSVGGEAPRTDIKQKIKCAHEHYIYIIPCTVMVAEPVDGLLLATVHV